MSDVKSEHPDYADRKDEWALMRDAARGETRIKAAKDKYLPKPSGFDGDEKLYAAYQLRAQVPEILAPTAAGLTGTIHRTESEITMPDAMQPLWERATRDGLPLEALHQRITLELLTTGRYGILVGASSEGADLPYLVGYTTESIINWDDDGSFYVLDESGPVREGFKWVDRLQYRVLALNEGVYKATVHKGDSLNEIKEVTPRSKGGDGLQAVPFVVMGARDVSPTPESPPLLAVARSVVSLYQLSADYRWQLFMTGQETPTFINCDAPDKIGAGTSITIKSDNPEITPDFKFVGPAGTGIEAHERAMETERESAAAAGAKLFDAEESSQESGEARKMRYASQTASLITVAVSGAKGLETALRHAGRMMGLSETVVADIVVKPNLSFINTKLSPQELAALVKAWQDNAISYETLYANLQRGEVATMERTVEEERKLIDEAIENEPVIVGALPTPANPSPVPEPLDA